MSCLLLILTSLISENALDAHINLQSHTHLRKYDQKVGYFVAKLFF